MHEDDFYKMKTLVVNDFVVGKRLGINTSCYYIFSIAGKSQFSTLGGFYNSLKLRWLE